MDDLILLSSFPDVAKDGNFPAAFLHRNHCKGVKRTLHRLSRRIVAVQEHLLPTVTDKVLPDARGTEFCKSLHHLCVGHANALSGCKGGKCVQHIVHAETSQLYRHALVLIDHIKLHTGLTTDNIHSTIVC